MVRFNRLVHLGRVDVMHVGRSRVSWVLFLGKSRGGLQKQFPERFIRVAGNGDLVRVPVVFQDRHATVWGHHPRELRFFVRAEQGYGNPALFGELGGVSVGCGPGWDVRE